MTMVFGEGSSSSKRMKIIEDENINQQFSALIVDDDPVIRKLHSVILNSLKVESQAVKNGKEAVDLYCSGANFHFVFMDMEMPLMNGIEATKKLRAMGVKSIIVGVSSRSSDEEKEEFMKAGLDQCYAKPLTVAKVKSLLKEMSKKK